MPHSPPESPLEVATETGERAAALSASSGSRRRGGSHGLLRRARADHTRASVPARREGAGVLDHRGSSFSGGRHALPRPPWRPSPTKETNETKKVGDAASPEGAAGVRKQTRETKEGARGCAGRPRGYGACRQRIRPAPSPPPGGAWPLQVLPERRGNCRRPHSPGRHRSADLSAGRRSGGFAARVVTPAGQLLVGEASNESRGRRPPKAGAIHPPWLVVGVKRREGAVLDDPGREYQWGYPVAGLLASLNTTAGNATASRRGRHEDPTAPEASGF